MGTVYLIHFAAPYKHARHYIGYTDNLAQRLAAHRAGTGANLIRVIQSHGIQWYVTRTWNGGRDLERRLKVIGHSVRYCPVCKNNSTGGTK